MAIHSDTLLTVVVVIHPTEKYTRGVSAVESILTLDRLRQSVAVKELQQAQGQTITMRKTASVPNFSQASDIFLPAYFYLNSMFLGQNIVSAKANGSLCGTMVFPIREMLRV